MRIGETYDEALQKAAELMRYYNGKLKTCETSEDVINLYKEYWDDPEVSGGVPSIRTIKGFKPINNFFRTREPDVVEYICDSDALVRKCKVQNLYRFVKFNINVPETWFVGDTVMNGQERNKQSLETLFSANIKDMEYYVDVSDDYGKLKQEYFYTKEDAIDFANKKNNIQGLSAKVYDKFGNQIESSRRPIKSEYDEEILISVGECGQGGDITVRKENGRWHGSDGKVFMGYLTPDEIVEWYDKDYGSAWLCNSRRPIKSSLPMKKVYDEFGLVDKYVGEHFDITVERGSLSSNRVSGYTVRNKNGDSMDLSFMTLAEAKDFVQRLENKGITNSHRPIKSGYAPYYNDSTISEKGKKAYEWLCDFVGQELELDSHPWYGPCVYLNVNKMNITQDMLEEINNKMYEMDGYNSITADSGSWGYGDVYIVTFDQIRKE